MEYHVNRFTRPALLDQHIGDEALLRALNLFYQRLAGTFMSGGGWGFEAAFSYTDLDFRDTRSGTGPATLLTDRFALNGVLPPRPRYRGTFNGPGTVIGATPGRTVTDETSTFRSDHHLDGQMFGFRFGPFIEWNFSRRFSVAFSGGLSLAPALLDYQFEEEIALDSGHTGPRAARQARPTCSTATTLAACSISKSLNSGAFTRVRSMKP
jgi:hypothetical protein